MSSDSSSPSLMRTGLKVLPLDTFPRPYPLDHTNQHLHVNPLSPDRQRPCLPLQPGNNLAVTRLPPDEHLPEGYHCQPGSRRVVNSEQTHPGRAASLPTPSAANAASWRGKQRGNRKRTENKTYQATSPFATRQTYPGYRAALARLVRSANAASISVLIVSVTSGGKSVSDGGPEQRNAAAMEARKEQIKRCETYQSTPPPPASLPAPGSGRTPTSWWPSRRRRRGCLRGRRGGSCVMCRRT